MRVPQTIIDLCLLSIFNKVFEKLIYKRLNSYLISKEMISKSQYGFQEKDSTERAILDIISKIQMNTPNIKEFWLTNTSTGSITLITSLKK